MFHINFGGETISYQLLWSNRRKTLGIAVQDNKVIVTAPAGTDEDKVLQIVKEKASWIRKQLSLNDEVHDESIQKDFISGEKLPYLGRMYRLKVIQTEPKQKPTLRFYQGRFFATVPENISEEDYRTVLYPLYKAWIKNKAATFTTTRMKRFTLLMQEQPTTIQIREQRQRWGSCTPDGKIILNWHIFLAPTSVIDYILVHELAHLKDMNHSNEFWHTVKVIMPNYEDKKEWLRINGKKLYI